MARRILIKDTTLRDGEQSYGVHFTPDQKLQLAIQLISRLRVDRLEVASTTVRNEDVAFRRIVEWARPAGMLERIEVLGFVNEGSVDWIIENGGTGVTVNLLAKAWRKHCEGQLKKTPAEHWGDVERVAAYARGKGLTVQLYLELWANGMQEMQDGPDGTPVSDPYVKDMVQRFSANPVFQRFILCDTLGIQQPQQAYQAVRCTRRWLKRKVPLSFHGHNDLDTVTANCLAAVRAGVDGVDVTVIGLGERSGNAKLHTVVENLRLKGLDVSVVRDEMRAASETVSVFSHRPIPVNEPFIGRDAFFNYCGVHADGDEKGGGDPLYVHAERRPENYGATLEHPLGKMSGKASIRANLKQLGFELDDAQVGKLLTQVVELSRVKPWITKFDLLSMVAQLLGRPDMVVFEVVSLKVDAAWPELGATVNGLVRFRGVEHSIYGTGDGFFSAFMAGLRTLAGTVPMRIPNLLDFRNTIPPPMSGEEPSDALVNTVTIWDRPDGSGRFITAGLHPNQVFSGIEAAVHAINLVNFSNGNGHA